MSNIITQSKAAKIIIMTSIILATILTGLNSTVTSVALPKLQRFFNLPQDTLALIITSYMVAMITAIPLVGWLAAKIGTKSLYMTAIIGFMLASIGCGMSNQFTILIAFRIIQGIFSAPLVPLSQTLILEITPKSKQPRALAIWGGCVMIGPIIGPILGGVITEYLYWSWIFYINIPIALIAFFGTLIFIKHKSFVKKRKFDYFGFAILTIALIAFQLFLDGRISKNWPAPLNIKIEFIIALFMMILFLWHITRGKSNYFQIELLKNKNYILGLIFTFVIGIVLFSTRTLMPQMLVYVGKFSNFTTGMLMVPTGLGTLFAMLVIRLYLHLYTMRTYLLIGSIIIIISMLQMSFYSVPISYFEIISSGFLFGAGLGIYFAALNAVTFSTLNKELRADGSAIFFLSRNLGGNIGISLFQALLIYLSVQHNRDMIHSSALTIITIHPYLVDFRIILISFLISLPLLKLME